MNKPLILILGSALFLLPLAGSLWFIFKSLLHAIRQSKSNNANIPVKIYVCYFFGITFGLLLFIYLTIKIWFPVVELSRWINAVALIVAAPYIGIIVGLNYGLGTAVAVSGLSANQVLKDLKKKNL